MPDYTHGGDLYTARSLYGGEVSDFSANLNPLGMPEQVRLAAERAVKTCVHYPDALCRALVEGLAVRDGVRPEYILCGNGAADLIFRLVFALKPRHALITAPTFSEYGQALGAAGCSIKSQLLVRENWFDLTDAVLDGLRVPIGLAFLCNPNNPTGRPISSRLMACILDQCAQQGIRLVVDECFLELSDSAQEGGLAALVDRYPNLILLRALTKSYAIAGLRLGYCITSDVELMERLGACGQPWSVSAPAQAAGLAALTCPGHPEKARELIKKERRWLIQQLEALGLWVCPSTANYLLFQAEGRAELKEQLLDRGILIRSCANYEGLGPDYYRIAVRLHPENSRFIQCMGEVL